jgi:hypothetical protein
VIFQALRCAPGSQQARFALIAANTPLAVAQLPNGNTGLGDARAKNLPTSVGIPSAFSRGGYGFYEGAARAITATARIGVGMGLRTPPSRLVVRANPVSESWRILSIRASLLSLR